MAPLPPPEPHLRHHGDDSRGAAGSSAGGADSSYQHQHQHQHQHEASPLLQAIHHVRHLSMEGKARWGSPGEIGTPSSDDTDRPGSTLISRIKKMFARRPPLTHILGALAVAAMLTFAAHSYRHAAAIAPPPSHVITIENAEESTLDLGDGISMWYRTWGNAQSGVPVLFVHGGPGNAVADYADINAKFFDAAKFWVVEPDQRGTGKSQPSVWDDWTNMKYYQDITIGMMAGDFETLREALGIERWLVFGGSWGSTLGLDYGERYPDRSLGLILRGIFLNTRPEFNDVYTRRRFLDNEKQLREFDVFFEYAAKEAGRMKGEEADERYPPPKLDPDDSERIVRLYNQMIWRGDRMAIWIWYVFENNLMEEDPDKLLDFDEIDPKQFPEACGVAFFESQLFLRGQFEEPFDLLGRVDNLLLPQLSKEEKEGDDENRGNANIKSGVHTWVCQGRRDQVCPQKYARQLVDALKTAGVPTTPNFVDAPHQCTDPVMQVCLKESVDDFHRRLTSGKLD